MFFNLSGYGIQFPEVRCCQSAAAALANADFNYLRNRIQP